jgi:predicted nucleotidyltransferase
MVNSEVSFDYAQLAEVCREFGVSRLRIFGSARRDDFDATRSDVDLLVEFLPGISASLFTLVEMEERLSQLFDRKVDLLTPGGLSKYIRDEVLSEAEPIYVSA